MQDNGQACCLGDGAEMRIEPRLRRLIVLRHHGQHGIGAVSFGASRKPYGGAR